MIRNHVEDLFNSFLTEHRFVPDAKRGTSGVIRAALGEIIIHACTEGPNSSKRQKPSFLCKETQVSADRPSIQTGIQNSLHGYTIQTHGIMHEGYTHNLLMCHAAVLKRADALMFFQIGPAGFKTGKPISKPAARFETVRVAKWSVTYPLGHVIHCMSVCVSVYMWWTDDGESQSDRFHYQCLQCSSLST